MPPHIPTRNSDHYEDFKGDLLEYMASKLQHYEVQRHELMEIAQYATMGMIWVANAEVRKAVHSMNRQRRGLPKVGVEDE